MHKDILEIEFKNRRKEFAENSMQFPFQAGDLAIVEVDKGIDLGKIAYVGVRPGFEVNQRPEISILRKATSTEVKVLEQNRMKEHEARSATKARIREHQLDMKLVDIELQWDGRKMTFYFTAEGRVDFRELVKDLAGHFRTRIDLRQIGARDETKKLSGYGVCGQPLCCATFLTEFKPITTQMPRDQFLPLNPTKLSGVCGRLKCCLRYEVDVYREFQRSCPKVGQPTKDEFKGNGVIDKIDVMREQIQIRYGNGEVDGYSPVEFKEISDWKPETPKSQCICTCGRKQQGVLAAKIVQEESEEDIRRIEEGPGEKVTLLAGGGLGLHGASGERNREVGLSVNVTPQRSDSKNRHDPNRGQQNRPQGSRPPQRPENQKNNPQQGIGQPQQGRRPTQQQQAQVPRPPQNPNQKPEQQPQPARPAQPQQPKPQQSQQNPQGQQSFAEGQNRSPQKKHHRGKHRGRGGSGGGNPQVPPNPSSQS